MSEEDVGAQNYAPSGVIVTYAGNGNIGSSGDGGAATSASLYYPSGIALDSSTGNLIVADQNNHRIRLVTKATGIVTTCAGKGNPGSMGDGGKATSASLYYPSGVALDGAGNVFIADMSNHRVRLVTKATGTITTYVGGGQLGSGGDGGAATSASLYYPSGVAVDSAGNVFIADSFNHKVRLVTKATGIITTFAGTGSAGSSGDGGVASAAALNKPTGVAVDGMGNLFIADHSNNRVRLVTRATGIIATCAGNGYSGAGGNGGAATNAFLNGPLGVAVDSDGNLFIADTLNNVVRVVTKATGIISTVAGTGSVGNGGDGGSATSATLNSPAGVAVDTVGNVFVADQYNQRIRVVTSSAGIITTSAGTLGAYGLSGDGGPATSATMGYPYGVAVDASGNVYVADHDNGYVRVIASSTSIITGYAGTAGQYGTTGDSGAATSALLTGPSGLAVDVSGNLYIADGYQGANKVRVVMKATGVINTVAGTGTQGSGGDGGAATSAQLNGPEGVAVDAFGNVYISDTANHRVRVVLLGYIISTVAGTGTAGSGGNNGPATSAMLNSPHGLAFDTSGNLYIADSGSNVIRTVARTTGIITLFAGTGVGGDGGPATSIGLSYPTGIALDATNNVFVTDNSNNRVHRVSAATGIITLVAGTGTVGGFGDGGSAISAQLSDPWGVAIDPYRGVLYVSDAYNNAVRSITYSFPCPPGTASSTGSSPCTACSAGTYSAAAGATSCTACPVGLVAGATGATACPLTATPTVVPTGQPTQQPTRQPTGQPTRQPKRQPSQQPTQQPTRQPTQQPTRQPSQQPTAQPTRRPTDQPTVRPTSAPTAPSGQPTAQPSRPTVPPTAAPSATPSFVPSYAPSTAAPSFTPSTTAPSSTPSSFAPNTATVTVQCSQTVTGVTDSSAFRNDFTNGLLATLPAGSTAVISTVTTTVSSRRVRYLLGSSSTSSLRVVYAVTAPQTTADALTAAMDHQSFLAALTTYLQGAYPGITVYAPTVTAVAAAAPGAAPTTTSLMTTNAIIGGVVGGVGGLALVVGLLWLWYNHRRRTQRMQRLDSLEVPTSPNGDTQL